MPHVWIRHGSVGNFNADIVREGARINFWPHAVSAHCLVCLVALKRNTVAAHKSSILLFSAMDPKIYITRLKIILECVSWLLRWLQLEIADASRSAKRKAGRGMPSMIFIYSVGRTTLRGFVHTSAAFLSAVIYCPWETVVPNGDPCLSSCRALFRRGCFVDRPSGHRHIQMPVP